MVKKTAGARPGLGRHVVLGIDGQVCEALIYSTKSVICILHNWLGVYSLFFMHAMILFVVHPLLMSLEREVARFMAVGFSSQFTQVARIFLARRFFHQYIYYTLGQGGSSQPITLGK